MGKQPHTIYWSAGLVGKRGTEDELFFKACYKPSRSEWGKDPMEMVQKKRCLGAPGDARTRGCEKTTDANQGQQKWQGQGP